MDREDLTFAAVALTAQVRKMPAALDVLAWENADRLRLVAAKFRELHNDFEPARRAADELDAIAQFGALALGRPAVPELVEFIASITKLAKERPTNRHSRRASEAIEARRRERIRRSARLRELAAAHERGRPH